MDTVFGLFSFVEDCTVQEKNAFVRYILREEFDTDAMSEDMKEHKTSNILQVTKDKQLRKIIYEHLQQNSCMFSYVLYLVTTANKFTHKK